MNWLFRKHLNKMSCRTHEQNTCGNHQINVSRLWITKRFWAEALSTATYLRNRSPTNAVQDKTPYESWTGKKPNISHLRVFGCDAYAHVAKDERSKLDLKTRRSIFLGYWEGVKGYRLYDNPQKMIFYSRNVVLMKQDQQSKMMSKMLHKMNHL